MNLNPAVAVRPVTAASASRQAYQALHFGFIVAPIAAGVDKFFHFLTDWDKYLAPQVAHMVTPIMTPHQFMLAIGAIEVAAGLLVAIRPRVGAYVVCLWLVGIIGNLLLLGNYYDVALRDLGLAIGAFALGRLAYEHSS